MRRFPLLLAAAIALAGCGAAPVDRPLGRDVTLALDRAADAADAGIYLAVQRGFDEARGRTLHPTPVSDPVRSARPARRGMAVLDIHELALARARGADLVGVLALVGPAGRGAAPAAAARATQRAPGAPPIPELVLAMLRATITDDPATVRGAVAALQRGYGEAYVDPDAATQALVTAVPGLRTAAVSAQLDRLGPDFQGTLPTFGELDPARLARGRRGSRSTGLVKRAPDRGARVRRAVRAVVGARRAAWRRTAWRASRAAPTRPLGSASPRA